ncbi:hypothetical protein DL93DRAFT_824129 [Clavulina sp. PMI_390]|nr:hypothetical protein DL93DRAFT_824129 [Clavulina sp. PMI_390]
MSPETSSGQRPRAATGPSRSPPPQSPPTITVARVGDPERPAWNPYSYSQPEVPHGDPIPRPGAPAPNRPVTAPPPSTDSDIISGKPPYPWHPTRSYTNENADSWAKYYAMGGTEPDGKVWFIPETLPVALGGRAQKHNQAWDPYRQARQNPGATAGPSQTQLKSPQSPLQAPELALPTISPKIAKREIVWDARPTAQDENPKRPNIKVPAATSKAPFSTSPVKSPEFLAMPYSSYNNNSTSDLENDGSEQPKKKKGLRHSMMASVRSSFDKVRTKDPLPQNEEEGHGWEVIRERATPSPSPPESDPTSPFNNPLPAFPAFPPRIGSPSPRLPSVSASSVTPVPLTPSASTPDIFTLVHSAATLDTHFTLNMSVTDFCAHVRASPHGRNAYLTKLVWHKELSGVKHEFMLVKIVYPSAMSPRPPSQPAGSTSPSPLRNDNGNPPPFETSGGTVTTWVRLDRAAQQGYKGIWSSQFRSSSAVFPANDTVSQEQCISFIPL